MASTLTTLMNSPLEGDSVLKFLVDGGSWADAIEMEALMRIPILEAQLKAALKKQNPSGRRHRIKLLAELVGDYAYLGKSNPDFDALLQEERAKESAAQAAAEALLAPKRPVPTARGAPTHWQRRPMPTAAPAMTPAARAPPQAPPKAPVKNVFASLAESDDE